jgi:RIO1 family
MVSGGRRPHFRRCHRSAGRRDAAIDAANLRSVEFLYLLLYRRCESPQHRGFCGISSLGQTVFRSPRVRISLAAQTRQGIVARQQTVTTDATGYPAPRLGELDLSAETAREYHRFLIQQIVRMLSIGLIHDDLSEFNVLVGSEGPVIIDLPQAVNAAANNSALEMLERDVNNIRGTLGRFAPELLRTEFAQEMWALFERGELTAESTLSGAFARDETPADAHAVLVAVEDAREEALQRELRRES